MFLQKRGAEQTPPTAEHAAIKHPLKWQWGEGGEVATPGPMSSCSFCWKSKPQEGSCVSGGCAGHCSARGWVYKTLPVSLPVTYALC